MTDQELIKTALSRFLTEQFDKKSQKQQRQLAKTIEEGKSDDAANLTAQIQDIKAKFERDTWLAHAVDSMARQLKFGTHISKGVHPDAQGDNVNFTPMFEPVATLVGSHLARSFLDANGNAAALPLASFFDFAVTDSIKVRDLIMTDNADFIASLATDVQLAKDYHHTFKSVLQGCSNNPSAHERNKQMLWCINDDADELSDWRYVNVVPLYPSALTYDVFLRINELRYSDENKQARDNRFKSTAIQKSYVSMPNLATVQLGGSKPQNISQLMSKQGGRNYLLPSFPPKISTDRGFGLSKFCDNFFDSKSLAYQVKEDLDFIMQVVEDSRNTVDVRNRRKDAIDRILHTIFRIAHQLQAQPAGWSQDYALPIHQKIWLDPYRCDLGGEDVLFEYKVNHHWQDEVMDEFAAWLNGQLRERFKKLKYAFADAEHTEWVREIDERQKFYTRLSMGVFV